MQPCFFDIYRFSRSQDMGGRWDRKTESVNLLVLVYKVQYSTCSYMGTLSVQHMNTGLDEQKFLSVKLNCKYFLNIFLPICFNICYGCSKEPSH